MENNLISHSITVDDRKTLNLTGIKEVVSFDDVTINVKSIMGRISVKGDKLHIVSFDENVGLLNITGLITSITYLSDSDSNGGFFSRLFR